MRLAPVQDVKVGVAYAWWITLGLLGAHWFYLRRPGRAVLYLFTMGVFTLGWFIDGFTLAGHVRRIRYRGF